MTTKTKSKKPAARAEKPKPAGDDVDQDRADVDNSLENLRAERDKYKSQLSTVKRKLSGAQNKVRNAELDFENADKQRKNAKAALDKAIADELALVNRFVNGEQDLPFPENDSSATTKPAAAPVGNDHAANESIDALLAKNIKKLAGPEVFDAAKEKGTPIGLTDKQLEIIKGADIKTVGDFEKRIREDAWFLKNLKGFGETAIDRLTDTLLAYRQVYPVPSEPEKPAEAAPAAETQPASELAAADQSAPATETTAA